MLVLRTKWLQLLIIMAMVVILWPQQAMAASAPPQEKKEVLTPKRIAVSAAVLETHIINKTKPAYPAIAKAARIQGTVVLAVTVSTTGTIENLKVIGGPEMLQAAAMKAVKTWEYTPFLVNGKPVAVDSQVKVIFNT